MKKIYVLSVITTNGAFWQSSICYDNLAKATDDANVLKKMSDVQEVAIRTFELYS